MNEVCDIKQGENRSKRQQVGESIESARMNGRDGGRSERNSKDKRTKSTEGF